MAEATEELQDQVSDNGNGSRLSGLASKDNLMPALATAAAAAAAGLAATKGPDLVKKLTGGIDSEAEELGGKAAEGAKEKIFGGGGGGGSMLGTVGKAASKLTGGGGGGQKGGKTRRLPIQRWTDVAVPVDRAYEAWTQWEEWPKFMHRVLEVKPSEDEDNKIHVSEKIWFWTREWDGEITEQRKNDRIAWKTDSGMQHSGVVSFHKLDDNLTRVMVDMDFLPTGMVEKMASGMRFVKRAVQSDLARFKAYVEFGDANELEYKSSPDEMEQHQGGDDDENKDDDQARGDRQDAENRSEAGDDESGDDGNTEEERQEREKRREERRKAMASS
ncbi:MAG TPA: SRPBCC family protein [Solirubrobacterales bacterium]|nr:SRPBCC family protein [Solirubrobacterales bacterium]